MFWLGALRAIVPSTDPPQQARDTLHQINMEPEKGSFIVWGSVEEASSATLAELTSERRTGTW